MDTLAPALVFALLHSLWQCALLAVAASLTLRALARASAATRHNVAMLFLLAMALTPAAQIMIYWQSDAPMISGMLPPFLTPQLDAMGISSSLLATPIVVLWLSGAIWILARHITGMREIGAMERAPYQHLPPFWRDRVESLRQTLRIRIEVAVRISNDVITPCVTRLLHPIIWLPASLLTRTPTDQLQALLAHELAHIARKDWLWNAVQCAVEALLFFHPAVWWLSRRIRQEREHACDDVAVAAGSDAIALAEALATLECARQTAPELGLAATGGSLLQRVTRLLSPPPRARGRVLGVLGTVMVFALVLVTQTGVGGGRLPDLHVASSTSGPLGPGDFREIIANDGNTVRFYCISVDAQGQLHEIYRENGRLRPIDHDVRAWLAEVMQQDLTSS